MTARTQTGGSVIIALAGGSGSGKSTLAKALQHELGLILQNSDAVRILPEDDYYHCATGIADFDPAQHDFDAPDSKDMDLLATHLQALRRGEAVEKPLYDFRLHERMAQHEKLAPPAIVILEGIHALTAPAVADAADLRIMLDAPGDVRLARRLLRDVSERARTMDSVIQQYFSTVRRNHEAFEPLARARADLVFTVTPDVDIAAFAAPTISALRERGLLPPA